MISRSTSNWALGARMSFNLGYRREKRTRDGVQASSVAGDAPRIWIVCHETTSFWSTVGNINIRYFGTILLLFQFATKMPPSSKRCIDSQSEIHDPKKLWVRDSILNDDSTENECSDRVLATPFWGMAQSRWTIRRKRLAVPWTSFFLLMSLNVPPSVFYSETT